MSMNRRSFIKSAGVVGAAATVVGVAETTEAAPKNAVIGPGVTSVQLNVNGKAQTVKIEPRTTLAVALRDHLHLTGTKIGCDRGSCSACTVHVDGKAMSACLMLAVDCTDRKITTIEGLAKGNTLAPIQTAFIQHDATQCGFCTPGMVMSCAALLSKNAKPTLDEVKTAVSGNTCRCGTYPKVFAACMAASGQPVPKGTDLSLVGPSESPALEPGQVLVGIGKTVRVETRMFPDDEPPSWPTNSALATVGKSTPRIDGRAKVTGAAKYTFDVQLPGMLHAKRLSATVPHARVLEVDTSAAEAHPGVKAVYVVEKQLEGAKPSDPGKEEKVKYPTIRYVGQVIAGVAATTAEAAEEGVRKIRVKYEELPFVVDLDQAMKPNAPTVYAGPVDMGGSAGGGGGSKGLPQKGNIRGPAKKERGDINKGLKEAAHTVTGTFRTQVQTHSAMETHGVVVDYKPDMMTVYASTQGPNTVRDELAAVFEMPASKIRVVAEYMGGGFGAKFGAGHPGVVAAHLSKRSGAPVRLMLDRHEEHLAGGNRPSSIQTLTIGADKQGALTAIKLESFGTGGIATGAGVGRVAEELYPSAAFLGEQYDVFTHASPCAAFRAPGVPQGVFAMETMIETLAEKLGVDPLVMRDRLDTAPESATDREARRIERQMGAEMIGWSKRHAPGADRGPVKRGIGVGQSIWWRFVDMGSNAEVRIHKDGGVEVRTSAMDLGTGTRTALAQLVAEELGLKVEQIAVRLGDTDFPQGPAAGGSKTLVGVTPAVRAAAWKAKQKLFAEIAPRLKTKPELLEAKGGKVYERGKEKAGITMQKACAMMKTDTIAHLAKRAEDYGGPPKGGYGGVQFAEVAVDVETGVVKVERMIAVQECGRLLNPLAVQSQINGGILHGLSWALYENRLLDQRTGRLLNGTLDTYKIAGAKETPQIDIVLLEQYVGRTNTDAHGIGEPANIATAAAIANAVYNAIGVRVKTLPMTPEVVLAALAASPASGSGSTRTKGE